tara:strand:- start:39 stop:335 length:297 start_codon:yes stop_codon:yes gene_type:complete
MITINVLEGCPYCNNSLEVLNKLGVKYKKVVVRPDQKDMFKKKYNQNSFPQILLKLNNKQILLGGNDDFMKTVNIMNLLNTSKINNEVLYLMLNEIRK